jgi:hypothetical protein
MRPRPQLAVGLAQGGYYHYEKEDFYRAERLSFFKTSDLCKIFKLLKKS